MRKKRPTNGILSQSDNFAPLIQRADPSSQASGDLPIDVTRGLRPSTDRIHIRYINTKTLQFSEHHYW